MTIKGLFKKQTIILMNINNKTKFIEESSDYITNINKIL